METIHKRFEAVHARLSELDYSALVDQQRGLHRLGIGRVLAVQALHETTAIETGVYLRAASEGNFTPASIHATFIRNNRPVHKAQEIYIPTDTGIAVSPAQYEASTITMVDVARSLGLTLCRQEVASGNYLPDLYVDEQELDFLDDFMNHPDNLLAASVTLRVPATFNETSFVMATQPANPSR